jgi:hypothetical protein
VGQMLRQVWGLCGNIICTKAVLLIKCVYSETSIYRSRIIHFPGSVVRFLWSLSKSYFNYSSRIYCFPRSIVSFSDPWRKRWIEVSLYIIWINLSNERRTCYFIHWTFHVAFQT